MKAFDFMIMPFYVEFIESGMTKNCIIHTTDINKAVRIFKDLQAGNNVIHYFAVTGDKAAQYQLCHSRLSMNKCDIFVNDIDNNMLGVSCGSFDTIEDALKDFGVIK